MQLCGTSTFSAQQVFFLNGLVIPTYNLCVDKLTCGTNCTEQVDVDGDDGSRSLCNAFNDLGNVRSISSTGTGTATSTKGTYVHLCAHSFHGHLTRTSVMYVLTYQ